jgi:acetylornithine deacetylase/succinyl-diaminopimelate desuccinylase-like protein
MIRWNCLTTCSITHSSPRTDIVAAEKGATLGELLQVFKRSRHSRFPVYEEDLDHICGIITMKDVLPLLTDDPSAVDRPLAELGVIKPALVVPESRHIGDLFADGTIKGGDKVNVVSDWCEFELDFRFLPGMSEKDFLRDLKKVIAKHTKRYSIIIEGVQKPFLLHKSHYLIMNLKKAMKNL